MNDFTGNNYLGDDSRLNGISGWLALFAFSMVLSILMALSGIILNIIPVFQDGSVQFIYNY
jgi:hypothetical protein